MNDLVSKCSTRAVLETKGGCEFWKKFPQILFYSGLNFSNTKKKKKNQSSKKSQIGSCIFISFSSSAPRTDEHQCIQNRDMDGSRKKKKQREVGRCSEETLGTE